MAVLSDFTQEKEQGLGSWILSVSPRLVNSTMVIIAHYTLEEDPPRGVFCSECGIDPVSDLRGSLTTGRQS